MKFSTTFTLAALMFMSSGTDARIGGNQRELHGHSHSHGHDHGQSKGKKCDPDIAGQCFTNGKYTGSDCKNVKLGGSHPDYRCTDPTPAPKPKKCHTNHNPTTTPECPSGYSCEALLGSSKKNAGQCTKQSDRRNLGREETKGQRELHGHHHSHDHGHHHSHDEDYYYDDYDYDSPAPAKGVRCQDPSTYNPTYTPQCINVGSGGYTCENVRMGGDAEYRCVAPPTPAAPVSCQDPSTYNKTFTPQCINVGSGGYTCKNVRLGGDALYQCVPPAPTAAPTSQETIPCHTNHNPTTTPECPSGYTCEALMGANPNTYDGQCIEDIYD